MPIINDESIQEQKAKTLDVFYVHSVKRHILVNVLEQRNDGFIEVPQICRSFINLLL